MNAPSDARPAPEIPLVELVRGSCGRLAGTELGREECQLLRALGLTDRCLLRVCQAGDPCIVQVQTTRIGLSHRLAERIRVVPEEGT